MWWLPLALGGATGLADALFGDEKRTYTKNDLYKYGYKDFDPGKQKGDLARLINSQLKNRRAISEAKNSQLGINNPSDIYSGEEGLYDAQVKGNSAIDQQNAEEENRIASMLFQLNESQPDESGIERFISGGLEGANIGANISNLMEKAGTPDLAGDNPVIDPKKVQPSIDPKKVDLLKTVTPIKNAVPDYDLLQQKGEDNSLSFNNEDDDPMDFFTKFLKQYNSGNTGKLSKYINLGVG